MTLEILLVQLTKLTNCTTAKVQLPNSAMILSPFSVQIKIGSAVAVGNILHA